MYLQINALFAVHVNILVAFYSVYFIDCDPNFLIYKKYVKNTGKHILTCKHRLNVTNYVDNECIFLKSVFISLRGKNAKKTRGFK